MNAADGCLDRLDWRQLAAMDAVGGSQCNTHYNVSFRQIDYLVYTRPETFCLMSNRHLPAKIDIAE
jgi:hypothetical protein